jgi:hypothetical protein
MNLPERFNLQFQDKTEGAEEVEVAEPVEGAPTKGGPKGGDKKKGKKDKKANKKDAEGAEKPETEHMAKPKQLEEWEIKCLEMKKLDYENYLKKDAADRLAIKGYIPDDEPESEKMNYEVSGHLKPGFKRPLIIHRAILGSVERFTAIIGEH